MFSFSSSKLLALIYSLPVLESLDVGCLRPSSGDDVDVAIFRPSTSPPLSGTLSFFLPMDDGIGCPIRRLIDLPVHFRRLECDLRWEADLPLIGAFMEACSDTLESICVEDGILGKLWAFSSCHVGLAPAQTCFRAR